MKQTSELTELQKIWEEVEIYPRIQPDGETSIIVSIQLGITHGAYNEYGETYFIFTKDGKRYRIGITEVKPRKKNGK